MDAGLGVDWLDRVAQSVGARQLVGAVEWLKHTIDTQLHTREIAEASRRISALLADAKQYSQMDRGDYRYVDLHELLRSTLMVFNTSVGADGPIGLVTEWDPELPKYCVTQVISIRCGPTSSRTRSRPWPATAR